MEMAATACRQVNFRPATVLVVVYDFLLSKSGGPQGDLVFSGNVSDWMFYFIAGICFVNQM